jgi:hypothetical protein
MASVTTTTNLSLRKPVKEDGISEDHNNLFGEFNTNMDSIDAAITSLASVAGRVGAVVINTNPSIVDTAGNRIVNLYASSAGSISTITGALLNVPFTLIMKSNGMSLALLDAGAMKINGNWIPDTADDNLSLVWDGTSYIELSRTPV